MGGGEGVSKTRYTVWVYLHVHVYMHGGGLDVWMYMCIYVCTVVCKWGGEREE